MRQSLTLLFLALLAPVFAQTPVADARQLAVGSNVTVRGIVTNGGELGSIRYLQDATGGIALFPGTGSVGFSPARGADITVSGTVKNYYGLLELDPITSVMVHSNGNTLPTPQVLTPSQVDENEEGELVRINGCVIAGAGTPFGSGTTDFTSSGQTGRIFLRGGHPLVGTTIPSGPIDLVAIVSQYSTATPPSGGYQLLPRTSADLLPASGITIIGDVQQTDILPDGFTLRWTTNIPGTSDVAYGTTQALGSNTSTGGTATQHAVAITGIDAATFVYARPSSTADGNTATAPIGLYSTASSIPGRIRVHFNQSVDQSVSLGTPASSLGNAIDDTIRAYIDHAQHTIEYAVYNTTNSSIVTSLNAAKNRGVQVRVIAEGSNSNSALDGLLSSIPVLYRQNSQGSGMHNKFIVTDADHAALAHLITGSTNCTNQSFYTDANNLVIVDDQALARCYRAEFNEMWGSSGAQPSSANSRFGSAKTDNTPHWFNICGTLVESRFSPSDGTTARIEAALGTADESIEFALFALTLGELTETLVDMEAEPGVTVRGLIESDDMSMSDYDELQDGGVDVHPDNMPGGAYLHHKYAIIDRAAASSDPQVVTGSHNWSYNAQTYNDENTLVIHSATVADQFYQEWHARWDNAVGLDEVAQAIGITAWPNPAKDVLNIAFAEPGGKAAWLHITDAAGRTVCTEQRAPAASWTIATSDLAPGSYVVTIELDGQRAHLTFVRE